MPTDQPHTPWKCLYCSTTRASPSPPTYQPAACRPPSCRRDNRPLQSPLSNPAGDLRLWPALRRRRDREVALKAKGRPWQRPAGQPTRGDPDLLPPAVVASGLAVCPWPLRPCPTPASPPVGNPVLHPPAVQPGVTLSAAAGCCTSAGVSPVFSLPTRSLQLQRQKRRQEKKSHPATPLPPPAKPLAGDPVLGRRPTVAAATCL